MCFVGNYIFLQAFQVLRANIIPQTVYRSKNFPTCVCVLWNKFFTITKSFSYHDWVGGSVVGWSVVGGLLVGVFKTFPSPCLKTISWNIYPLWKLLPTKLNTIILGSNFRWKLPKENTPKLMQIFPKSM